MYGDSEQQRRWSECVDAQADLRLCCSHVALDMFSHDHDVVRKEFRELFCA